MILRATVNNINISELIGKFTSLSGILKPLASILAGKVINYAAARRLLRDAVNEFFEKRAFGIKIGELNIESRERSADIEAELCEADHKKLLALFTPLLSDSFRELAQTDGDTCERLGEMFNGLPEYVTSKLSQAELEAVETFLIRKYKAELINLINEKLRGEGLSLYLTDLELDLI